MAQKIVDLDAVAGQPIKVKLGGKHYLVPADCPTPLYLRMLNLADQGDPDDPQIVAQLYGDVLELFRVHQPDLESLPLGLTQLVESLGLIYGADDEAAAADPTPPKANAGTKSSKTKARTSSRSTRS